MNTSTQLRIFITKRDFCAEKKKALIAVIETIEEFEHKILRETNPFETLSYMARINHQILFFKAILHDEDQTKH